ncbi:MAG: class I SAM-dependent methyltransferase [Deltaproteobacteria bacterium]|nr:class I SAM-dependent methyltransferase [Deltaproteobacteria bacterium]
MRLLSDHARNEALIEVLRRHAPGNRVVEVGCGSGLMSCIAARLGARKVYAVEPTPLWEEAARLVRDNGLQDRVEVIPGMVQDLAPREVDFAFSELLNADPFYEEVLDAMEAVAPWVAPNGTLAPNRLRVWLALVRAPGSAGEARKAREEVRRASAAFDLDVGHLLSVLTCRESYRYHTTAEHPITAPVKVFDLPVGGSERPPMSTRVTVRVEDPGPIGGAMVWFEADLDEGIVLANPPGGEDHWGQLICAWAKEIPGVSGAEMALEVRVVDGELEVLPV